jgi:VWFA-related protein
MGLSTGCQILLLGGVLLPAVGIAQTSLAEPDVPAPFANAQNLSPSAQQPRTATFTAKTDLVLVPVVVRQGKQPVTGLTKNDFKIFENKTAQTIAFVKPTTPNPELRRPGGGGFFTNELEGYGEAPRLTVIAVDTINTPLADQSWVSWQVLKFLADSSALQEPTSLLAITPDGLRLIHDFTTDTASLIAAFEHAAGKKAPKVSQASASNDATPSFSQDKSPAVLGVLSWVENESVQDPSRLVERLTRTLEALSIVAQSLSGIPGRKTLVWFTGAFPFSGLDDPGTFLKPNLAYHGKEKRNRQSGTDVFAQDSVASAYEKYQVFANNSSLLLRNDELEILRPLYERTTKQLADANVAVYPADARGVVVTFPGADEHHEVRQELENTGTLDLGAEAATQESLRHISMRNFADMTGGSPCYSTNDLGSCLRNAISDSESYYLLGYYRDKKNDKPGWRTLKVEVNRPGVQVLARDGYFYLTEAPDTNEARRRDISYALISPIDFSGIPFTVQVKQASGADAQQGTLNFQLHIPPASLMDDASGNHHMSLELVASAVTPKGEIVDKFSKTWEGRLKPETAQTILTQGVSYSATLRAPAGDLTLRFIVRDNVNGRIGSVVVPFAVK